MVSYIDLKFSIGSPHDLLKDNIKSVEEIMNKYHKEIEKILATILKDDVGKEDLEALKDDWKEFMKTIFKELCEAGELRTVIAPSVQRETEHRIRLP